LCTGTGRSWSWPRRKLPRSASGSRKADADDARRQEVGQLRNTDEVAERRQTTGRGGDGGKGADQRKLAPAKRVPDTAPVRRAQCAGAGTASGKTGQEDAAHRAPAPCLRRLAPARGVLRAEEGCGSGGGWRNMAALR